MTTRPERSDPIRIPIAIAALLLGPLLQVAGGQDDPGPLASDPRFEATLTEGPAVTGRIRSLSPSGGVTLVVEEGEEREIDAGTLVKLSREGLHPIEDGADAAVLVFPGFERIRGIIDSADERAIAIRSPILGELEVPLEAVLGFTTGPSSDPSATNRTIRALIEATRTSDLLLLENGDRREITFSAMTTDEISYRDADRALRLPRRTVRAIGLDPGLVQYPEPDPPALDLLLTDGSRIRLLESRSEGGRLAGRTAFGAEVDLSLGHVSELYALSDSIVYLSDQQAAREVTIPYVGPRRPVAPNGSVIGGPLVVGGRTYVRGLGTQSRSLLAYRLGPDDRRFQARVAMDDAAGPRGNVVFRVLVDGEERFASPPMPAGAEPIPIDVDLSGGRFLILATDFGRGGGVRDYAAWIEARLIRSKPSPGEEPEPESVGN
ncbi:NPCBM/NEW2 domain-containing protein [Tautonia plasticadhaerens]|uniref:NPCBM/NEW2 domain protein n=1 Tax=Tautonia plasticadhaerens TaxID=2527974 RepID=A0A518GYF1_9BACT|nr:NPCBM/NEW2 domain-containing protein [Tautonia plasticadhaerens]QDV33614.1 NPCBM/NEW2 domain protein [Tautonia plasticadhaerens]